MASRDAVGLRRSGMGCVAIVVLVATAMAAFGCDDKKKAEATAASASVGLEPLAKASTAPSAATSASASTSAAVSATSAESPVVDLVVGTGKEAKDGSRVKVHYAAFYTNGKQFETSRDRKPKAFVVGAGQVIKGWDQGVVGMRVGGKRKLTIPPALAYGDKGSLPTIPPNATLVFEVELLDVQ